MASRAREVRSHAEPADEGLEHLRAQAFRLARIYNLSQGHQGRVVQADFWCEGC
jgi:ABC-type Mn2+/Zn2+ transport system ATPase subunit